MHDPNWRDHIIPWLRVSDTPKRPRAEYIAQPRTPRHIEDAIEAYLEQGMTCYSAIARQVGCTHTVVARVARDTGWDD